MQKFSCEFSKESFENTWLIIWNDHGRSLGYSSWVVWKNSESSVYFFYVQILGAKSNKENLKVDLSIVYLNSVSFTLSFGMYAYFDYHLEPYSRFLYWIRQRMNIFLMKIEINKYYLLDMRRYAIKSISNKIYNWY